MMAAKKFGSIALFTLLLTLQAPIRGMTFPMMGTRGDSERLSRQISRTPGQELEPAQIQRLAEQAAKTMVQAEQALEQGRYDPAIALFQQAQQLFQQLPSEVFNEQVRDCREGIAKAYLLKGESQTALSLLEPLLMERQRADEVTVRFIGLLALTYYEVGNYARAEQLSRQLVNHWETLRSQGDSDDQSRITLADQLGYIYRLLQKSLVAQSKTDAALEVAELTRARALVAILSQRQQQPTPLPTLEQLRQIARSQNSTLVMYSIVGREMRVLNIEPRDETDIYIWVITPGGAITFRPVSLQKAGIQSLRELVLATREQGIGVRGRGLGVVATDNSRDPARGTNPARHHASLQKLHQLLIAPIADLLPKDVTAHLTLIPESSLLLVPFAALPNEAGHYLIERHTLRVSPSIQLLELTRQQQQRRDQSRLVFAPETALIVGNPVMPSLPTQANQPPQPLDSLPEAEREARAIASLLKTQPLLGQQATKQAVVQRLPQASLIHLATHGLLDLDANLNEFGELTIQPTTTARASGVFIGPGVILGPNVTIGGVPASVSAAREGVNRIEIPGTLALAPTAGDNGFLSAKEILTMTLRAQLAVLSACDTGRGRITGDGAVGLARAFIGAGVPSVVVSLWAVPDAPTAALMTEFYRNLQQTPDKAQALRQAMLTTRQQYPAPRDWAAFTLIGEARSSLFVY